jgi:hypothetical protein
LSFGRSSCHFELAIQSGFLTRVRITERIAPARGRLTRPTRRRHKGNPEYDAGMALAIERGWLTMHESGTYVRFTPAGADLFA